MTAALKVIYVALFFSLCVTLIAFLPSVDQYPLPPEFAASLGTIFGYYYSWVTVFTSLNTLLLCVFIFISVETVVFIFKIITWIMGFVSRFIG